MPHSQPSLTVPQLVEQIARLSPSQRRQLLRWLQVNGLLESDERLTDRRPLEVAPAVRRPGSALPAPQELSQGRTFVPAQAEAPREGLSDAVSETAPGAGAGAGTEGEAGEGAGEEAGEEGEDEEEGEPKAYHSPVRGRVVVGAPDEEGQEPAPHAMPPLPGQAPEEPIRIIFDGGSRGNPGPGYGSYVIYWPGRPRQVVQLQFGEMVTNNEAEYDTLIAALEAVLARLREHGADPSTARVAIWGDSQLVVKQVNGEWKTREPRLRVRRDRARELLARFGSWRLEHHAREHSVRELGH